MQIHLFKLIFLAILAYPSSSLLWAAQAPASMKGRPELELANGDTHRERLLIQYTPPKRAATSWNAFIVDTKGQWNAIWDSDSGVPLRIYGSGISAPNSISNPNVAAQYATATLKKHIKLLAPGTSLQDFIMVSNGIHRGVRTIGYKQMHAGVRVIGGQVSFRFKADRLVVIGSEAMPFPKVSLTALAPESNIKQAARDWILQDSASIAKVQSITGPLILPLIVNHQTSYKQVIEVEISASAPIGRWVVYVDAQSATPIARKQTLRFAEGRVRFNAPIRHPNGKRKLYPAPQLSMTVGTTPTESDITGGVSWPGVGPIDIQLSPSGPLINVVSHSGSAASKVLSITDGGDADWNEAKDEKLDAQLIAYIHAFIVKEKVRTLNPDLAWLNTTLPVNVNIDDACNAFSDGDSINFFVESSQCANTGRLADVIYHEFGHSMHAHSIIEGVGAFDGAFSEGLSDYLSASITGDSGMGVGFFKDDSPLRQIDPDNKENIWPDDVGEIHHTGIIFAGAMWDLRKLLVEQYGEDAGGMLTDRLFYATVQRSSSIPATYIEIILEDDDDGDLSNGTPNLCDINAAFGAHGLRALSGFSGHLDTVSPTLDNYEVKLEIADLAIQCPGDRVKSASLNWKLESQPDNNGKVEMTDTSGVLTGLIPATVDGNVVNYQVQVQFADGSKKTFPDNLADPFYEFYVGETVELYCTNFDEDPFNNGWTHGLSKGNEAAGADDWTWGVPQTSPTSGDPNKAFSGEKVVGNDLGGNDFDGNYQPDKVNYLLSPIIDLQKYQDIRIQYRRWLNVEDGFFDQATIYSNDKLVWTNLNTNSEDDSTTHHTDKEWRFHDVPLIGTAKEGKVQIKFEISSDAGLNMGGWTIDDFCVVANSNSVCGDAKIYGSEECDDGSKNSNEPNHCRSSCLLPTCGDGILDDGESCDDGNLINGDGCENTCLFLDEAQGDCGCTVGPASKPWKKSTLFIALFALFGLAYLRRSRKKHDSI